jgi:uncharacterized protein (DUF1330 family)
MAAAYMIANIKILDGEMFQSYRGNVSPQLIEFGCEFIVVNDNIVGSEGSPEPTIVILKFESMEAAMKWYESSEYEPIKKLRTNSTEGWAAFSEEFVMPG